MKLQPCYRDRAVNNLVIIKFQCTIFYQNLDDLFAAEFSNSDVFIF